VIDVIAIEKQQIIAISRKTIYFYYKFLLYVPFSANEADQTDAVLRQYRSVIINVTQRTEQGSNGTAQIQAEGPSLSCQRDLRYRKIASVSVSRQDEVSVPYIVREQSFTNKEKSKVEIITLPKTEIKFRDIVGADIPHRQLEESKRPQTSKCSRRKNK
jgi:hypothetical protein